MALPRAIMSLVQHEAVNFALTNRMPRRRATQLMGWFSRIENPLVCALSLRVWRLFTDIDLSDAEDVRYRSLHACFTRRLRDGARAIERASGIVTSPCDAIVGASGRIEGSQVLQVKGQTYTLEDLLHDPAHAAIFRDGCYVTLRLTSAMYHRFHAPHDCDVESVTHVFGDTWNVNPPTLKRVTRVFCRNERAIIRTRLSATGDDVTLVAVAAILVAGIRLNFLEMPVGAARKINRTYDVAAHFVKAQEMGWFEHGSTILVFAPKGFALADDIGAGARVRMGQPLLSLPT